MSRRNGQVILIRSLALVFLLSTVAQAVEPNFRAGVINVTEVKANSDGSADVMLEVRQQLEKSADSSVLPYLSGGFKVLSVSPDASGAGIKDLTGEEYSDVLLSASIKVSKSSLTPSAAQDSSYGCRSSSFNVIDRIASLSNKSFSNADFSVTSRFNVVDNNDRSLVGGARKVYVQKNPAPNYNGPLYFEMMAGSLSEIDLAPYIVADSNYTCALVTTKDKHGIANTGLAEIPAAAGKALAVSSDCIIRWDNSGADLGEKFGLRVKITSSKSDPICKSPYTYLDLIIQIGCAAGDLTCLQCKNLDLAEILASTQKAFAAQQSYLKYWFKKNSKVRIKLPIATDSQDYRARLRRLATRFRARNKRQVQAINSNFAAQTETIQHCLRPSKLFCSELDKSHLVEPTLTEVEKTRKATYRWIKSVKKLLYQISNGKRNILRKATLGRMEAQRLAEATKAAVGPLAGKVSQCN